MRFADPVDYEKIKVDDRLSLTGLAEIAPGDLSVYESPETTHYSVMDAEGNAVVNTYTLMFSYGSGVVIDPRGIVLTNFHVSKPCGTALSSWKT